MFKIYKEKIKRTSLSVGGATDLPEDHQLQRLPPLLTELGGWHQCQQVEEVVVVRAMVEEVVETEAYLAIH